MGGVVVGGVGGVVVGTVGQMVVGQWVGTHVVALRADNINLRFPDFTFGGAVVGIGASIG